MHSSTHSHTHTIFQKSKTLPRSYDLALSLYTVRPTEVHALALEPFKLKPEGLGAVEKLFLEMLDVPRYAQRLECFLFKHDFKSEARPIHPPTLPP